MKAYREGLPPIPKIMWRLPVDERGYPVPWFVAKVNGKFDFRVADAGKRQLAAHRRLCWVCGWPIRTWLHFILGPMCALTRTTSEPALHWECAEFSVTACPFLTLPKAQYRDANLPEGTHAAGGLPLTRNPGVVAIWKTRDFTTFQTGNHQIPGELPGWLIRVGEPNRVWWVREGRSATAAEVIASIDSGLPALRELALSDPDPGGAMRELEMSRDIIVNGWIPPDEVAA